MGFAFCIRYSKYTHGLGCSTHFKRIPGTLEVVIAGNTETFYRFLSSTHTPFLGAIFLIYNPTNTQV